MSPRTPHGTLILLRHGQSIWNITDPSVGLVSRFTGWADIALTSHGVLQAEAAGRSLVSLRRFGKIDAAYCSLLSRAVDTCDIVLKECGLKLHVGESKVATPSKKTLNFAGCYKIPVTYSWRLNERHYGGLVGLSKAAVEQKYSSELLHQWRYSWHTRPPPMDEDLRLYWEKNAGWCKTITHSTKPRASTNSIREGRERGGMWPKMSMLTTEPSVSSTGFAAMPRCESLCDCAWRFLPLWTESIAPRLRRGESVLVVAHANTIRSALYYLDPVRVKKDNLKEVKIPSAVPLVYR
mmetsp:Transcript_37967/g.88344  ORF Transcript_37967/g.88344 Transcript_37967/m.88344 type:complete len:294 (+) Transcript_37967:90-971(+)